MGSDSKEGQHLPSAVQRLLDSRTFKHLNVTSSLVATALTVMLIATFFPSVVADLAPRLGPDGERSGKSCTKRMKHFVFK